MDLPLSIDEVMALLGYKQVEVISLQKRVRELEAAIQDLKSDRGVFSPQSAAQLLKEEEKEE